MDINGLNLRIGNIWKKHQRDTSRWFKKTKLSKFGICLDFIEQTELKKSNKII